MASRKCKTKKGKSQPPLPVCLTEDQLDDLADKLRDTDQSVTELALSMYGHEWTGDDYERLEDLCEVFSCDDCGLWQDSSERGEEDYTICQSCEVELFDE